MAIGKDLTSRQKHQVKEIAKVFASVFSGATKLTEQEVNLTADEPVRARPYPSVRSALDTDIQNMLCMGIIRESKSPYSAPVVKKPYRRNIICVDYRKITKIDPRNPFPQCQIYFND